jgi:hypothetical protein
MTVPKSSLIAILILIAHANSFAQNDSTRVPNIAVKWSPLAMTSYLPTLQLSLEKRLNNKFNLNTDLGLVLNYKGTETEDFANRKGFRVLLEPRWYLPSTATQAPFYLALELYFHRITYDRSEVIGRDCQGSDCLYFQYMTSRKVYLQERVAFKIGFLTYPPLGPSRSLYFDWSLGLGFRNVDSRYVGDHTLPPNSIFFGSSSNGWFHRDIPRNGGNFVPVAAIRIGYKIN